MKPRLHRVCIYPKDIQRITGRSERYCRELLHIIRKHYGKADHQFVTVQEFCRYAGLDLNEVQPFLND